jgi:hypothetical protein
VIEAFLDELVARLAAVGVRGGPARRIVAEARDHLHEAAREAGEEAAIQRFGRADNLARTVAAELATGTTRRAVYGTFEALALAGVGYVIAFLLVPAAGGWPDLLGGRFPAVGVAAALGMAVLPQIAFVSGSLALLRAVRLRRRPAVVAAELRLLRRRSAIALVAGMGALAALATSAVDSVGSVAAWWTWTTEALCVVLFFVLVLATVGVMRSAAPTALEGGPAGDVFDDLAPVFRIELLRRLELPGHPWRFAFISAAAVGVAGFAGGFYAEGDPGSGLVRGGFEALALLGCFALFGRALGLRRAR